MAAWLFIPECGRAFAWLVTFGQFRSTASGVVDRLWLVVFILVALATRR